MSEINQMTSDLHERLLPLEPSFASAGTEIE